jgi:hypothetical protein
MSHSTRTYLDLESTLNITTVLYLDSRITTTQLHASPIINIISNVDFTDAEKENLCALLVTLGRTFNYTGYA